jgi:two-component system, OmpR family, response regulator MtrA
MPSRLLPVSAVCRGRGQLMAVNVTTQNTTAAMPRDSLRPAPTPATLPAPRHQTRTTGGGVPRSPPGWRPAPGPAAWDNGPAVASILLVEDDPSVREAVTLALEGDGHRVETAVSGEEALSRWRRSRPELILLDVMLPGTDGLEVCRQVRRDDQVPIVMLTARSDAIDVVLGLESGADDYVTKPFETRVLLARVKAVLRRQARGPQAQAVRAGGLVIDPAAMTVTRVADGAEVRVTPTEFKLLYELARRPGLVFTRAMLLEQVWDYAYLGDSRLVDVCVQRLRAKVEDDPSHPRLVQTVRGVGYKLVP